MAEYIDKEVAIHEINQITAVHYGSMWDYAVHVYAGACLRDCKEAIDGIPAADVAPVVHGRWDENGYCTNCGKHAPFWPVSSCYYESPYCQNCGAKMDEEAKE